ncbi:YbfB/YjiJ family MFS transporter [Chrysiogenes arsenatis]|uniref:YbfB/YjiJ family MFS transporter n=1 Tax=Chrysiogenes arsenatis TaxID=309797 RepID=UPI000429FFE4|nr:YbfB/YjiJ family MFS transporter [Chrysiogenes arsenatis]
MRPIYAKKYLPALGGMLALAVAMGTGRFAYTPLLPFMQSGAGFDDSIAGIIASWNYAGYLAGALVFGHIPRRFHSTGFRLSLTLILIVTIAMGIAEGLTTWYALRFLAGVLSAAIFVFGSLLVMEALALRGAIHLSGIMYSGVGVGIALSAIGVAPLCDFFGWKEAWIGIGVLSIFPVAFAWLWVKSESLARTSTTKVTTGLNAPQSEKPLRGIFIRLGVAYFLEGLGYVVSVTFLVLIVRTLLDSPVAGTISWLLVGVSAAVSTIFWPQIAARYGESRSLMAAYFIQSIGIASPVFWPTTFGAYLSAVLLGGTFMGIVSLTIMYGRKLAPHKAGTSVGMLTALVGAGQIIAPALAGYIAKIQGNFTVPLLFAAGLVALGGVILAADAWKAHKPA